MKHYRRMRRDPNMHKRPRRRPHKSWKGLAKCK